MHHPISILKILGLLLFFLLFFLSAALPVRAVEEILLQRMQKEENPGHTRIVLYLSALPEFSMENSGQRVDLLLRGVEVADSLKSLPEDENVVKILLADKARDLLVSTLLRRPPQQVVSESQNSPPRIRMDIYWDGPDASRPAVAFRIADMPPRKAGRKATLFQQESPWVGHWRDFFRDYRSSWKLTLPLRYTLPQLPSLVSDEQSPLWPLQQHADNGMFLSLLQAAGSLEGLTPEQVYLRDLLVAEAQLRTDALAAGVARLDQLRRQEGAEQVRVEYLTAYGQALDGQPVVAQLTLQALLQRIAGEQHPLQPEIQLLYAETALVSKQDQVALEHLSSSEISWPDRLLPIVQLRRADARAGLGELPQALEAYHELVDEPGLFDSCLFSCNRAAFSAFEAKDYAFATELYRRLVEMTADRPGHDLILFAAGAAAYESGDLAWGMIGLQRAILDSPNTEGGDRAALRLIDHSVFSGGDLELSQAAIDYGKLAQDSRFLNVREESQFKQALALDLLGEHGASVEELMTFRRDFSSSALRREADLLLARQLPKVVRRLLEEKNDLQAVVLVEQNRKLLLSNDLDRSFLRDLATAFDKLGLYERAGRVLLYLFDRLDGKPEQESLYLPLATSFLKREAYRQAGDYADRYLEKYPQGEDAGALFGILLDAYERQGEDGKLIKWLGRRDRPSSFDLEIRAAWIYWRQGQLAEAVASLERAQQAGPLEVKEMALLAESQYQLERLADAENNYRQLQDDPQFGLQAGYRTAQILLRRQDRGEALSLLERVAKNGAGDAWAQLARDLLIQEKR